MDTFQLSVIIPCYNGADTIGCQLAALEGQRWDMPWEVIVVDNRSTDASREVVLSFQERLPNLRLVDGFAQQGQPYALNTGVAAARSQALAFCDVDDEVGTGWVAAIGEALQHHDFVAARFDFEKLNEPWMLRYRPNPQPGGIQRYTMPPYLPHAGGGSLGVKRDLFYRVGGFDDAFPALHDTDFCWKVQRLGVPLTPVPSAVLHVRLRDSLYSLFRQAMAYGEYNVKLYVKYRPLGMPHLSWRVGARAWKRLLRRLRRLRHPDQRPPVVYGLGWRLGRLKGCLKYRTTAL